MTLDEAWGHTPRLMPLPKCPCASPCALAARRRSALCRDAIHRATCRGPLSVHLPCQLPPAQQQFQSGICAVLALDAAFLTWLGRGVEQREEDAYGYMAASLWVFLWGCRYPVVLCVSAVRERVRARFVVLCPPFAWQAVPSTHWASVFMCASPSIFAQRNLQYALVTHSVLRTALFGPHCSTTGVTERID